MNNRLLFSGFFAVALMASCTPKHYQLVGVERIFPIESPNIESIEINKIGKVRRAKLYYLRKLTGKAARIKEKRRAITAE